ncbi:MAG: hypothetical protein IKL22_13105 [Lachnospiraceae bacterium]|nr:hypothetical protein [Lachnospiraceae bacterium]MBR6666640.1 hypothetical protein [Lachnospiraceae bacterium]
MKENAKNKIIVFLMGGILLILSLVCWFKPAKEYSDSERRALAKFPELSKETILSGRFMKDFETYTLDQFPMRDTFRGVKSFSTLYLFREKEINDLFIKDGYVIKAEYPLSQPMIDNAAKKFTSIYEKYLQGTDTNIFLSIVPDKNYFAGTNSGRLSMDYSKLASSLTEQLPQFQYLDLFDSLKLEDYYYTDTHWKQENLLSAAGILASGMGVPISTEYETKEVTEDFYGVYYGQLALPLKPDKIKYLTNSILESCVVTNYDTGMPVVTPMYDLSKATSKDPYELFLCGNSALVTIENPNALTSKELIVFRDSFGSSMVPLLATGYSKVTLVDIRYINSGMLGGFIKFKDQDVLFLYSTLVLNSSTSFK